jgi:DNA-binding winged helix-turn-helix (wHTH) protein
MPSGSQFHFDAFRLDPANAQLWCGTHVLTLRPKSFAVLHYLVMHAGALMTKQALLEVVWPETAVSDAVLKVCIAEIRQALGDGVKAPRFIATVHRRGYRFLAPVTAVDVPATAPVVGALPLGVAEAASQRPPIAERNLPPAVGREVELVQLQRCLDRVRQGVRQVVLVTGEAGICKTAVVEGWLARVAADTTLWVARGQCVEHYGPGEAYMPVLEAIGRLCRMPAEKRLVPFLRQHAPTWLAQTPWTLSVEDREALQRQLAGATPYRMVRELAEALETLTAEMPLVVVLEDLHWNDTATLDVVTVLAQRREPARLLRVATYRPAEVRVSHHPLLAVTRTLTQHGHSVELPLQPLSEAAVATYLSAQLPGCPRTAEWHACYTSVRKASRFSSDTWSMR